MAAERKKHTILLEFHEHINLTPESCSKTISQSIVKHVNELCEHLSHVELIHMKAETEDFKTTKGGE